MSDHLLVGLDGSPESVSAMRWAAWFAATTQRTLHLAHAWQQGVPVEKLASARAPATLTAEEFELHVESTMRELADRELEAPGIVTSYRTLRGPTSTSLVKEAARTDACALVVGARGAGGALRALLGSVSRQLTECPTRAVVIVPDLDVVPVAGPWSVMVGVDGSAASSRALRWAAESARRGGGEVVAVHAFEPPEPDLTVTEQESLNDEARRRLDEEWCAPLRAFGVTYRSVLEWGGATDVIGRVAASTRPSCVVTGSRGLGAFTGRLLGSVTHHLVRQLAFPTVVIPSPRDCPVWAP